MKKYSIIILLTLLSTKVYSHKDFTSVKDCENIRVITTTSFYYEDINRTFIIGEYISFLSKKLNIKDSITVHFYKNYNSEHKKIKFNKDLLLFEYKSTEFDIIKILNLLEYVMTNGFNIEKLSTEKLLNIENRNPSKIVEEILNKRVYRPKEISNLNIDEIYSYYVENNKYYIYEKVGNDEKTRVILDNVYQINSTNKKQLIIFDTKESFYYIDSISKANYTKIKFNNEEYNKPLEVFALSKNIITIKLCKGYNDEKIIIYIVNKEKIIENIENM